MTDNFIPPNDKAGELGTTNQGAADLAPDDTGTTDTHSPEHQLSVMQQRLKDKDDFINTLKTENQSTREMYTTLEERMKNMESISEVLSNKGKDQDVASQDTKLDKDELVGEVIKNLKAEQTQEKMKTNFDTVVSRLVNDFGDTGANEKVRLAAQSNSLSVEDMIETARKSPQAFYKLMGIDATKQFSTQPTRSNTNAPLDEGQEKGHAYYADLMRSNPREYWKPDVQREYRKLFIKN